MRRNSSIAACPACSSPAATAIGFVEKVQDISHNRSVADLEVGYFFTPKFRAFTMANAGYSHGGIDFPINGPGRAAASSTVLNHDQIQKVHHLDLGAGAAYSISDSFDVFGSFSRLVAGRNGHALESGDHRRRELELQPQEERRPISAITASAPAGPRAHGLETVTARRREGSLVRCICQKSAIVDRRPLRDESVSVDRAGCDRRNVNSSDPIRS